MKGITSMVETNPKPFVFVLMPFSEEFNDVYDLGIKPACKNAGAYCERVDEQTFIETILERIYNQIAKADILVSEMTGQNANVFYETGYAHALNKPVILLTRDAKDIPFDLKHYPHIVYGKRISVLKAQLQKKIRWYILNPQKSASRIDTNLQVFIHALWEDIVPDPTALLIELPEIRLTHTDQIKLTIDIYNPTSEVIEESSMSLSLISPEKIECRYPQVRSTVRLFDGRYMYNLQLGFYLFPGSWESFSLRFDRSGLKNERDKPKEFTVRVSSRLGLVDFPFIVKGL